MGITVPGSLVGARPDLLYFIIIITINCLEAIAKAQKQQLETKNAVKNDKEVKNGEVRTESMTDGMNQINKTEEKKAEKKPEPVRDKSKPVSSNPVPGTPWSVCLTYNIRV